MHCQVLLTDIVFLLRISHVVVSYVPLLQSYKNTCVYHTQNATFITHNLHATAYNYAQGSGSRLIVNSLKGYNYEYNRDCSALFGSSSTENENYKTEIELLKSDIIVRFTTISCLHHHLL